MQKTSNFQEKQPAKGGIFKWIIGILLLGGIVGGCFLVYRWWTKPTPEQIEQSKEHEKILEEQIEAIQKVINENQVILERTKKGDEEAPKSLNKIEEYRDSPDFDHSNKELVELQEKKNQLISKYQELGDEWNDLVREKKKTAENLWERQKDGRWEKLTDGLSKSSIITDYFDKFIRTFYQRFGEKKGIKINEPRIVFYGFGNFYVEEAAVGSPFAEMGHTCAPEDDNDIATLSGKITRFPMEIDLNQIYLLNHGTIGMDKFFRSSPSTNGGFPIDFDSLTETIAHEIAHAVQSVKNIDNQRKSKHQSDKLLFTQCTSSGEREKPNGEGNLLHPDWASEHTQLTTEIRQMIESSPEYQEFKKWWQSSN